MRKVGTTMSSFLLRAAIIATLMFSGVMIAGAAPVADNGDDFLRIIYSGSLIGNIEPCG